MTSKVTRRRRWPPNWLAWAGGGVLLGLVIGLICGWVIWPVEWVDTDPSDLREAHKLSYVRMVADSLAVNGDTKLAGERLYELTETDADWAKVAALVDTAATLSARAGKMEEADRLRSLAQTVRLPAPPAPAVTAGGAKPVSSSPEDSAAYGSAVLVLIALALLAWLGARILRRRQQPATVPARPSPRLSRTAGRPGGVDATRKRSAGEYTESRSAYRQGGTPGSPFETVAPGKDLAAEPREALPVVDEDDLVPLDEGDGEPVLLSDLEEGAAEPTTTFGDTAPATSAEGTARASEAVWGEFDAEYRLGDDDFYYAFTLESPAHEFAGQCGIVSSDILSAGQSQHVDAFDIWLFETQGSRTATKVLVSPFASEDAALSAKLARRGELIVARPGTNVTIEGTALRLSVQVKDCVYLPVQQADEAVFSQLAVRMIVQPLR